jgi:hypothetical protein
VRAWSGDGSGRGVLEAYASEAEKMLAKVRAAPPHTSHLNARLSTSVEAAPIDENILSHLLA